MVADTGIEAPRLLRIASVYHFVLGGVPALLPHDLLNFLDLDPPRYWALFYGVVAGPIFAGLLLELARSKAHLRPGLLCAVIAFDLAVLLFLSFFIQWSGLPYVLFGPAVAGGLWAWVLWGLIPEEDA